MTSIKEQFESLGLGDFAKSLEQTDQHGRHEPSSVLWRGEPLPSGHLFHLKAADVTEIKAMMSLLSEPPIVLNTLPDIEMLEKAKQSYYVENEGVMSRVLHAHAEAGDTCFLILPALALRADPQSPTPDKLGYTLEVLSQKVNALRSFGVVVLLADVDMHEGKSDARRFLQRYATQTLK